MPRPARVSYHDIKRAVTSRIQSRIWPQGTLLPTEAQLCAEFGCARATVSRALRELSDQGVVTRKRKSGTRVAILPPERARLEIPVTRRTVEDMGAAYTYALISRAEVATPAWLTAAIGAQENAPALHLTALHSADGTPFQLEERWILIAAVPNVREADFAAITPTEWLLAEVPFNDAEIAFSAIPADGNLPSLLNAAPGAPLFRLERTTWLEGAPVTRVHMTYRPGYQMRARY